MSSTKHQELCSHCPASNLLKALQNLIAASGHISPFGAEASVKAVRRAAKYMDALAKAEAAIAKATGAA